MSSAARTHRALPHTADAGFVATAPSLPELFEEAGRALAELVADVDPTAETDRWEDVALDATDLTGLAFGWLNELIALIDIQRSAIVTTRIDRLEGPVPPVVDGPYRLRARVGLRAADALGVRLLHQPKSATYHDLSVAHTGAGWTMRAYLDL